MINFNINKNLYATRSCPMHSTMKNNATEYLSKERGLTNDGSEPIDIGGQQNQKEGSKDLIAVIKIMRSYLIKPELSKWSLIKTAISRSSSVCLQALTLIGLDEVDNGRKNKAKVIKKLVLEFTKKEQVKPSELAMFVASWKATLYAPFAVDNNVKALITYDTILANILFRCVQQMIGDQP